MDFIEPCPGLQRSDTRHLRSGILELTQAEAKKLGIGKSTLHYLRKNARNDASFKVHQRVFRKLE